MTIERTANVTITARSDAAAVAQARKVLVAPDNRWTASVPVVISRDGFRRRVSVTFKLSA